MQRFVLPGLGGVHPDSGFSDSNRHRAMPLRLCVA